MNAPVILNDTRLASFEAFVDDQADKAAGGDDALPTLAMGFARAVYEGVVDPAKDHNGEDAATRYFKRYAAREGKKALHVRTPGGVKANISKLKQIEKAAAQTKYDFVDVLNRGFVILGKAADDELDVKPAYAAFVDLARAQLKQDDALSDAMILSVVCKSEVTKEVTLESLLKKIHKMSEDIITGEKYPGVQSQAPEIIQIEELSRTLLDATIKLRERNEAVASAIAAGFVLNPDGSLAVALSI